jgi:hypothetical protein
MRVKVPMRGTRADQLVVVLKPLKWRRSDGVGSSALLFGQPIMGGTKRQGKVAENSDWMISAG